MIKLIWKGHRSRYYIYKIRNILLGIIIGILIMILLYPRLTAFSNFY